MCPSTIRVEPQKLASAVAGWSVVEKTERPHVLKAITFFDGDPKLQASLVPDQSSRAQQTWQLLGQNSTYWMTCAYTGTTVVLARALPQAVRECTVIYAPNATIEGSPAVQKLACK